MNSASLPRVSSPERLARVAATCVLLEGCLVLLGWAFANPALRSVFPDLVAMNPVTAIAFMFAGVSLWAVWTDSTRTRLIGQACAWAVVLIALLKLASFFGLDVGIDRLLFREQ